MLNLTVNIFSLIMVTLLLVCLWLILPESAKLVVQRWVSCVWRKVACEWSLLRKRNEAIREALAEEAKAKAAEKKE